jgi:uncharacterized membrane protein YeaQ/YmgE (transglycosylase-associated protein family)
MEDVVAVAPGGLVSLLLVLAIGAVAGWLAGRIVTGSGSGLVMNVMVGIAGAFVAGWLLPVVGIGVSSLVGALAAATAGAALLLLVVRLLVRS